PQPEPEKPRYLLPDGCKDLIDALRLQQQEADEELSEPSLGSLAGDETLPAVVALPDHVIVRDLALALHLKPFEVVASLMQLNVFALLNTTLEFDTACKLCSLYGVIATKIA